MRLGHPCGLRCLFRESVETIRENLGFLLATFFGIREGILVRTFERVS